jgi:glycosyltransferase involved in cell wall biosynthesis
MNAETPAQEASGGLPIVAFIFNVPTPYRVAFHKRIIRELPSIRLVSVFTHDQPDQPWDFGDLASINSVQFGHGQPVVQTNKPRWLRTEWRRGGEIARWIRDQDVGAVVLGGYADLTRYRIIRACRRLKVPCFVFADSNIRGDFARGWKLKLKRAYVGWVVRHVSGLLPCGRLGMAFFERYGARRERCFFMPYEPDYALIQGLDPIWIEQVRAKHALDPARRRIVVCCRLMEFKRVDVAIDSLAAIAAERPQWDLVIIGSGPERAALETRVPESLRSRVRFLGFIGDEREIAAIYRASDVLLHPASYEPWALVINEAAAAGMAIAASDVTGAAYELVRDGVNGRLFPPGDLIAATAALRECTDPHRIEFLKQGSTSMLANWRMTGDPIDGLRKALQTNGQDQFFVDRSKHRSPINALSRNHDLTSRS